MSETTDAGNQHVVNISDDNDGLCTYEARLPFPTARLATIVCEAVNADPELRPEQVTRDMSVDHETLVIRLSATDVKHLRTAVTSLYDFVQVSITTLATVPHN